jgi:hypothetical protein
MAVDHKLNRHLPTASCQAATRMNPSATPAPTADATPIAASPFSHQTPQIQLPPGWHLARRQTLPVPRATPRWSCHCAVLEGVCLVCVFMVPYAAITGRNCIRGRNCRQQIEAACSGQPPQTKQGPPSPTSKPPLTAACARRRPPWEQPPGSSS